MCLSSFEFRVSGFEFQASDSSRDRLRPTRNSKLETWLFQDLRQDIALAHYFEFLASFFDLAAGVAAKQNLVADFHAQWRAVATVAELSGPDGKHFPALWLLFRGVRQQDPAGRLFFGLQRLHQDAVIEGSNRHHLSPWIRF